MTGNNQSEKYQLKRLNNNSPLISVVVATYNGERFIGQQLESIINQTYKNIEIIVVDDCSTDSTSTILKEYAEKYIFLKVFINEQNLGYIKNFEKGLSLAKGELIAPSDQDDIWYLNKLEFLLENINEYPIIYCNSELIDDNNFANGKKLSDIKRLTTYNSCINYSIGNSAAGHAMLIRKEIIDECYPFPDMIPHDYWIGFIATFFGEIKYIDKVLIKYRQHSANVFGVGKRKGGTNSLRKKKNDYTTAKMKAIERVNILYNKCPDSFIKEKQFYRKLNETYEKQSFINNLKRVLIFINFRDEIMVFKDRNQFRKILFCLKMFFKIV